MKNLSYQNTEAKTPVIPTIHFITMKVIKMQDGNPGDASLLFSLPYAANVQITLFDTMGIEIETIHNQWKNSGTHVVDCRFDHLPKGTYFYKLKTSYDTTIKILTVD